MSNYNGTTCVEHSGLYMNEVEITSIYCGGCNMLLDMTTATTTYPSGAVCFNMDSCGCIRVNDRYYLQTKGNILVKPASMYDADYESEDEDSDDDYPEDDSDDDEDSDDDDE